MWGIFLVATFSSPILAWEESSKGDECQRGRCFKVEESFHPTAKKKRMMSLIWWWSIVKQLTHFSTSPDTAREKLWKALFRKKTFDQKHMHLSKSEHANVLPSPLLNYITYKEHLISYRVSESVISIFRCTRIRGMFIYQISHNFITHFSFEFSGFMIWNKWSASFWHIFT